MQVPHPLMPQLTQVVNVMHQGSNKFTLQPIKITFSKPYYLSCIWDRFLWYDEDSLVLELTAKPLPSITEIERNFFLRLGTNKTSLNYKELLDSIWMRIVPNHAPGYLASSPRSTCTPESFKLENNYRDDVICRDAPLSTYHASLIIILVETQDTNEKSFSNLATNSFIWVSTEATTCFYCCFPLPFLSRHYDA